LEDGVLTDSEGHRVDFTHTLVILTSNLGAKHLVGRRTPLGFGTLPSDTAAREEAVREAKAHFSPELLGRLDEILVFYALGGESLCAIAERLLQELETRAAAQGIQLTHTPAAARLLAEEGSDPESGARGLRHTITRRVEQCLAMELLKNAGDARFLLDVRQGRLSLLHRQERDAPPPPVAACTFCQPISRA